MNAGDTVADFELPDQEGVPVKLSDLLAKGPVVLFFYPGALTPGCTVESCHFRDLAAEFAEVGAQIVGISADPVDKQQRFATKYTFGYPLLSDVDRAVAEAFGVKRRFVTPVKRATFVINPDSTVREVIKSEINMNVHADKALKSLRAG